MSESREDIENVEAWAEVFRAILSRVPTDQRVAVLALVTKNEEGRRAEYAKHGGFKPVNAASVDWRSHPANRYWKVVMRLKSLLIQILVRDITNNHSAKDAAAILFAEHPFGCGSRRLGDYLSRLPGLENADA